MVIASKTYIAGNLQKNKYFIEKSYKRLTKDFQSNHKAFLLVSQDIFYFPDQKNNFLSIDIGEAIGANFIFD